jgi:hypothetical protein
MKHLLLFTLLFLYTAGWVDSCEPKSESPCDTQLWARTYGAMTRFADPPARLNLHHRCVTVTGTVVGNVSEERDGDWKIKLKLGRENFKPYGPFNGPGDILNEKNADGILVVEVVCGNPKKILKAQEEEPDPAKKPYYQGMIDACKGYTNRVVKPATGDAISVVGELLTDTGPSSKNPIQDHGWREIHPVTKITVLGKAKVLYEQR